MRCIIRNSPVYFLSRSYLLSLSLDFLSVRLSVSLSLRSIPALFPFPPFSHRIVSNVPQVKQSQGYRRTLIAILYAVNGTWGKREPRGESICARISLDFTLCRQLLARVTQKEGKNLIRSEVRTMYITGREGKVEQREREGERKKTLTLFISRVNFAEFHNSLWAAK